MSNPKLEERIKNRKDQITEMLLLDARSEFAEREDVIDYLLDLQAIKNAKTFKDICDLSMRDYEEEIELLKVEVQQ